MGEIDLWQSAFNSGELTPLLEGRTDLARYPNGCRRLRNAHGIIQGPARRRTGGRFVATTKSSGEAWLHPFIRERRLAYMLEFGESYIRFYRNRAQLLDSTSPFDPYEVATPWTYSELTDTDGTFKLRTVQSNDILYICSPDSGEPVKKLSRFGDINWTLTDFETVGGPFDSQNDTSTTIYASAQTGTVTLTASSAIFTADKIGSLLRLQPQDLSLVPPWEPIRSFELDDLCRNDGKTYKSLSSSSGHPVNILFTGTVGPIHEEGSASDGQGQTVDPIDGTGDPRDTGILWEFQDPGYGVLKITAVASGGLTATATVEPWRVGSNAQLPAAVVGSGNASTRWNWGLFSIANGFPTSVTFFRERLVLANNRSFAFSTLGSFEDFSQETAGQVLSDNAFTATLSSDRDETILWMAPAHNLLMVGTTGGEHTVGELTTQQVFGPNNRKSEPQSGFGSNGVTPQRVGNQLVFCEASGLRIRATQLGETGIDSPSQNDLAEHITQGGVIQTSFTAMPDNLHWCLTANGNLPCMTFSREQDVFGWSLHFIGGYRDASKLQGAKVESIATIPSPDGTIDDLWYIAERRINGATERFVEFLTPNTPKPLRWHMEPMEAYRRRLQDWQCDLVYMDSAATFDDPETISNISVSGGVVTVTVTGHPFSDGDIVRFDDILGTWELNARAWEIENSTTNTFDLVDVDGTDFTDYVSGGEARKHVTTISNLDMWEGETLQVVVDGAVHPDRTVSSGSIELQFGGGRIHTGYNSNMIVETERPEGGNEKGSSQGKTGRNTRITMRVEGTIGGKIGPDEDNLDIVEYRTALDAMDVAIPPFSGDIEIDFPEGQSVMRNIVFVQDQPLPATITGFGSQIEVHSD